MRFVVRRKSAAFVAAIDLDDAVLELQAGQFCHQRLIVIDLDVHESIGHIRRQDRWLRIRAAGRASVERRGVGAGRFQVGRHAPFVMHLDQKHAPALLDKLRRCRPASNLHAAFGVDINSGQAALIENFLDRLDGVIGIGNRDCLVERGLLVFGQRLAEQVESFGNSFDLRLERLSFDAAIRPYASAWLPVMLR